MSTLPFDIDIASHCEGWGDISALAARAVSAIWAKLDAPKAGELSLALMDDGQIQKLNKDFRGKDKPTNVLSFPCEFHGEGPAPLLGDIALALETVTREAGEKNISLADHTTHLIIHGFLHLQGYDHETEAEAAVMEALEIAALMDLNIDNPYEISEP